MSCVKIQRDPEFIIAALFDPAPFSYPGLPGAAVAEGGAVAPGAPTVSAVVARPRPVESVGAVFFHAVALPSLLFAVA